MTKKKREIMKKLNKRILERWQKKIERENEKIK